MKILGVDTIEFGIDIDDYDKEFFNILNKLEELKSVSQEKLKEEIININGINFSVKRKGQGFYAYKIECKDFYICFMKHNMKNNSPVYVRFMSEFIWKYGFEECYSLFIKWFEEFKVEILGTRVSRLDICFDTEEITININDKDKFVTRARKVDVHYIEEKQVINSEHYIGNTFTGFVIGRGSPLSCRIYNKSLEIKNKKEWFVTIWEQYNYNSNNDVWRIEFQARRKVLRELKIDSYEDIKDRLLETWAYYTQKWLILKDKNNSNVSRCPISKKWILVQKGGNKYNSNPSIRNVIKNGDVERLLNQCSGLLVSIAAIKNTSMNDTYLEVARHIREKNSETNTSFEKEVNKRRNRFL